MTRTSIGDVAEKVQCKPGELLLRTCGHSSSSVRTNGGGKQKTREAERLYAPDGMDAVSVEAVPSPNSGADHNALKHRAQHDSAPITTRRRSTDPAAHAVRSASSARGRSASASAACWRPSARLVAVILASSRAGSEVLGSADEPCGVVVSGKLRKGSLILGQVGNQAIVIAVISDPTTGRVAEPRAGQLMDHHLAGQLLSWVGPA